MITEFAYAGRLNDPVGASRKFYTRYYDNDYFSWEVGWMKNAGERFALGGTAYYGLAEGANRFGLKSRVRWWLFSALSVDLGAGVLIKENHIRCAGGLEAAIAGTIHALPVDVATSADVALLECSVPVPMVLPDPSSSGEKKKSGGARSTRTEPAVGLEWRAERGSPTVEIASLGGGAGSRSRGWDARWSSFDASRARCPRRAFAGGFARCCGSVVVPRVDEDDSDCAALLICPNSSEQTI